MLHACVQKFDVTGTERKILGTKQSLILAPCHQMGVWLLFSAELDRHQEGCWIGSVISNCSRGDRAVIVSVSGQGLLLNLLTGCPRSTRTLGTDSRFELVSRERPFSFYGMRRVEY